MNFGEKVKNLRKNRDMSAIELSRLSGLSQPFISDIEAGRRSNPTSDTLEKLSKALRVAPSYFIDDDIITPLDIMPNMPQEIKDFLLNSDNMSYLKLSQKAKENGISPGTIERMLDTLLDAMNSKKD